MRKTIGKIKSASLARRERRRLVIRKKVAGTAERPRLCTSKSNKHIVVQAIDDDTSKTLFTVATFGKNAVEGAGKNREGAKKLGVKIAEKLKESKIESAVFDRNGLKYTGVLASLADSVREQGIRI